MRTITVLLIGILFAFTACEKETVEPPSDFTDIVGKWQRTFDDNGVATPYIDINGVEYSYEMTIHNLCEGEIDVYQNRIFNRTFKFYLTLKDGELHISYLYDAPVMLPEYGWNMYLQYDNVLLIEYQQWLRI